MKLPKVIALIGPSGAGKSSIVKEVTKKTDVVFIKSYTTRQKRDLNDDSHIFISPQKFNEMQNEGEFVGVLEIFNHRYALPKLPNTKTVILLLRLPAIKKLKTLYPSSYVVQIEAPIPILENRLKKRGSLERADKKALEREIILGKTVADEIVINNKSLNEAVSKVIFIVKNNVY